MMPERHRKRQTSLQAAQSPRQSANSGLVSAISKAIRQIPRGRVSTYGAIAKAAGYPRCARHVARVLKLVDGLPWQRVLGSGGRISLRGELAMEQRFLLEAEGVRFRGRRADMKAFEHRYGREGGSGKSSAKAARKQRVPRK
jgi:methylated-DNA-protein-cysteine methyltransferase related protein